MTRGSVLQQAYGSEEADEQFACNYGLNPRFAHVFRNGLRITGVDLEGAVRAVELDGHPFFAATLYLPQVRSAPGAPHPLVVAFVRAALSFGGSGR